MVMGFVVVNFIRNFKINTHSHKKQLYMSFYDDSQVHFELSMLTTLHFGHGFDS
jgi:hypothetical protein